MKRILHVVGAMPRAGAETMLMNLYRRIDRKKFQFDFLYFSTLESAYDKEILKMGGRILYCCRGSIFPSLVQIFKTYSIIKKNGPFYAIHAHTLFNIPFSLISAWFAGISIRIAHSHNTSDCHSTSSSGRLYQNISRRLIHLISTKFLACGNAAGEYLFPYNSSTSIVSLPNAVDLQKFEPKELGKENEFGISKDQFVIIQIGRLTEEKNFAFSVQLAADLIKKGIDVKCIFVGCGHLETELKTLSHAKGLDNTIEWTGIRNDIPALLQMADVMILPSFFEGFPVVLVEAQAVGIPCLVSNKVSKEVDIGLNIVSFLSIDSTQEWIDKIKDIHRKDKPKPSSQIIAAAFSQRDLTIEKTVPKLYKCYE